MEAISTADVILFCSYSATMRFASWLGEEVRIPALLKITASKHTDTVPPVGIRGRLGFSCDVVLFPSWVALALSTSGARLVNGKFLYNVSMSRETSSSPSVVKEFRPFEDIERGSFSVSILYLTLLGKWKYCYKTLMFSSLLSVFSFFVLFFVVFCLFVFIAAQTGWRHKVT